MSEQTDALFVTEVLSDALETEGYDSESNASIIDAVTSSLAVAGYEIRRPAVAGDDLGNGLVAVPREEIDGMAARLARAETKIADLVDENGALRTDIVEAVQALDDADKYAETDPDYQGSPFRDHVQSILELHGTDTAQIEAERNGTQSNETR